MLFSGPRVTRTLNVVRPIHNYYIHNIITLLLYYILLFYVNLERNARFQKFLMLLLLPIIFIIYCLQFKRCIFLLYLAERKYFVRRKLPKQNIIISK